MGTSTFKSRPVYAPLQVRAGMLHVMVADQAGAAAIIDLASTAGPEFLDRAMIFYLARSASPTGRLSPLHPLGARKCHEVSDIGDMLLRLAASLDAAFMGTQAYLAGSEGLIGRSMKVALDAGMTLDSIQAEHRGSDARRVQCVHCKGVMEDVTTQPCPCAHCGLTLFVRDHYSRRIAAFQGVCIDAEEPGTAPPVVGIFR